MNEKQGALFTPPKPTREERFVEDWAIRGRGVLEIPRGPAADPVVPLARRDGPPESKKAAAEIVPELPALYAKVLGLVWANHGKTASELASIAGARDPRQVGRRLPELTGKHGIRKGASRRCTITGKTAATWWPA